MKQLIYCVDFDGTLAENCYPHIGQPKWNVINFCKKVKAKGHILILWTCRFDKLLQNAIDFCKEMGLEFDYINENAPQRTELYGNDSRKIGADYYIDDKAILPDMI